MRIEVMTERRLRETLAIPDLSDPKNGIHAINLVVQKLVTGFIELADWPTPEVVRTNPITTVANNFDRLRFPKDNTGRSSIYTRYVSHDTVLRTHTSAMIPDVLQKARERGVDDYLVICPGICYRRDVVNKTHCGEPHQLDIWRVRKGEPRLERQALISLIETVISLVVPGCEYRANEVKHPYTINGLEVEILVKGEWLEVLECGEAHPEVLNDAGLNPEEYSGLAMGMGLDRLVMIIKGIDDIRILRSEDPRIKRQMANLDHYQPVSKYPPVRQDMSFSVANECTEEDICEAIRDAMDDKVEILEEVTILSETAYDDLPPQAIQRLGIKPGQKNILARIVLRSHERSLLQEEANELRNRVYLGVNQSGTHGYLS